MDADEWWPATGDLLLVKKVSQPTDWNVDPLLVWMSFLNYVYLTIGGCGQLVDLRVSDHITWDKVDEREVSINGMIPRPQPRKSRKKLSEQSENGLKLLCLNLMRSNHDCLKKNFWSEQMTNEARSPKGRMNLMWSLSKAVIIDHHSYSPIYHVEYLLF